MSKRSKLKNKDLGRVSKDISGASKDIGIASKDIGRTSKDIGRASKDIGRASKDIGRASKDISRRSRTTSTASKNEDASTRHNVGYKRPTRRTLRKTVNKITYKYLPTNYIELPYDWEWNEEDHPLPVVPPSTPQPEDFRFEFRFQRLPHILQDLSTLEIPLVRECGIKRCIEELGLYFGCKEYQFNYMQFWFLDILTDCIWRAQDRYEFPPDQQKTILSWILFVIDIIGDINHSYTQREFFEIFKESIIAAAEVLEEGANEILLPLKLIKIRTGHDSDVLEENETYASSSEKTCTIESSSTKVSGYSEESKQKDIMDYDSVYEIHLGRDKLQVVLDHEVCQCSDYDESLSKHIKQEAEVYETSELDWMECEEEEMFEHCDIDDAWDYRDFYKPSSRTPSRFLQSSSEEITEVTETLQKENNLSLTDLGSLSKLTFLRLPSATRNSKSATKIADKLNNYIIFRKISFSSMDETEGAEEIEIIKTQPDQSTSVIKEEVDTQEKQIEKIMKGLQKLKLIEHRMRDLSDSNVGLSDWQIDSPKEEEKKDSSVKEDCMPDQILQDHIYAPPNIESLNDSELMNFSILWAIIDFVYDYFSDSFQYSLIKSALTVSPNVFTQVINKLYQIPKKISEDLTANVPDIKEKYKKFYRKVELKKSISSPKKGKEKEVKEDKKKKQDEKDKAKTAKKDTVKKESKDVKLTKEEMLRIQKLQQEEALRVKMERDKAFMFPLSEAVNDKFFSRKFPNWSKFQSLTSKGKSKKK